MRLDRFGIALGARLLSGLLGAALPLVESADVGAEVLIHEIRVDQPGTDRDDPRW